LQLIELKPLSILGDFVFHALVVAVGADLTPPKLLHSVACAPTPFVQLIELKPLSILGDVVFHALVVAIAGLRDGAPVPITAAEALRQWRRFGEMPMKGAGGRNR
jgi:hypothetical protein